MEAFLHDVRYGCILAKTPITAIVVITLAWVRVNTAIEFSILTDGSSPLPSRSRNNCRVGFSTSGRRFRHSILRCSTCAGRQTLPTSRHGLGIAGFSVEHKPQ